jgi:carbon-monoxide dehydrogenase large subunit
MTAPEPGVRASAGPVRVGAPLRRREDGRLLTGRGCFVADLQLPGTLHVAFVRSPHAHARVASVDGSAARALAGVHGVFTQADMGPAGAPLPLVVPHPDLRAVTQCPLAPGEVRFAGEGVAAVVAESRYLAEDARERVRVAYEPLPAVVDLERAAAVGSPRVHAALPDNVAARVAQSVGDVDAAFAHADRVLRERFVIHRGAGMPMEPRATAAEYEPRTRRLTVWSTTQTPHTLARALAAALGLPQAAVRVIAPDVGGGFGPKVLIYPEEVAVAWLAVRLRRPVKYVEDRAEHMLATAHERDQVHDVEVALRHDGSILALRDRFLWDCGAFVPRGIVVPLLTSVTVPGPYRIPAYAVEFTAVYTDRVPSTPMRGSGRPQGVFVMERVMDHVARLVGRDPQELRFRHFIQPEQFPYDTGLVSRDGSPRRYDSGDYPACHRRALDVLGYGQARVRPASAPARGPLIGVAAASYVEDTGLGPYEGVSVRVEPSGRVGVASGCASQGQGHETMLSQIVAAALDVDLDAVDVTVGDSGALPYGFGTYAARVGVVAGNSAQLAAERLREKAFAIAARLLEAAPADLELRQGRVQVRGAPQRGLALAEIATVACGARVGYSLPAGIAPGFEETAYFSPGQSTYASGSHAAVVEVDPATGEVRVLRYVVVHDSGRLINPLVVAGQVQGGVAHGIGNALLERMVYDERGQLLTSTLMDYLLPSAPSVPGIEQIHLETPSPLNPLGVKGAGEGGTIPVPAVIAAAVEDALAPLGVSISDVPLSEARLWELIAAAGRDRGDA